MIQLVIPYKKHASTTSRLIAQKFGKLHKNVIQSINNMECSEEFRRLNFQLTHYETDLPTGGKRKDTEYIITRDGFVFLVMGFTGNQAAKFKEEYLAQFNRMEAMLLQKEAPSLIPVYTQRILSEPTKGVPRGYWSVFDKSHAIMLLIEAKIGSINKYDLADGSIGIKWSQYREGKSWAVEYKWYTHEYGDERGDRECKCYHNSEYLEFEDWLMYVYKYEHLYTYLHKKFKREKNLVMLDKVEAVLPKLLNKAS